MDGSFPNERRQLVYFDFDNTLTYLDTTLPYAWILGNYQRKYFQFICFCTLILLYRIGKLSNTKLKSSFARLFLANRTQKEIRDLTVEFHRVFTRRILIQDVLDILIAHIERGDRVFLLSANFDCLIEPLKEEWGIDGFIATTLALHQGCYTGTVKGRACHGPEKVLRAIEFFGPERVRQAIAYGDGRDDYYLLGSVGRGYLVVSKRKPLRRLIFHALSLFSRIGSKGKATAESSDSAASTGQDVRILDFHMHKLKEEER